MPRDTSNISVRGAREHNLRNVSLKLPHGKLICFTGVSGSGKTSFAFDTLFAEGQRRYLESLSSYARQFLGQLPKPDVDLVSGLSPAIAIQQKTGGWNPRSTVGTVTQIQDYLRVLFARVGRQHCPSCGEPISAQTREQILSRILELPTGSRAFILSPIVRGQKGEHADLLQDMIRQGYARARIDGSFVALTDAIRLARNIRHDIEVVVDRVVVRSSNRSRLAESVEDALRLGEGTLLVHILPDSDKHPPRTSETTPRRSGGAGRNRTKEEARDILLSAHYACSQCALSLDPPSPQLLSFNSPIGMCQMCDGLGDTFDFDPKLLVPDQRKSFWDLAIEPMRAPIGRWRRHIYGGVAAYLGVDLGMPWERLPGNARDALLYGLGDRHVAFEWRMGRRTWRHGGTFSGIIAELRERYRKARSDFARAYFEKYMRKTQCASCAGGRLNTQARSLRIADLNIAEIAAKPIKDALLFFERLDLSSVERVIADEALKEIRGRLGFLCDVGLGFLTLDRAAPSLSGGESQRIRLASQIGAGLVGVLYVLDEPSIGLHPRDNRRLLESLQRLRDMGNTVIVVEHDEMTIRCADQIVDFGPGPGVLGGRIVAQGDVRRLQQTRNSLTGRYLLGDERIEIPKRRRRVPGLPGL